MSGPQKTLVLFMFIIAAALRVTLGASPAAGQRILPASLVLPASPVGWIKDGEALQASEPGVTAKSATYHAPDGSLLVLSCRAAWPDRRSIPISFYPNDCNYLGQGWDFDDRGSALALGNGAAATRIVVSQKTERRLDLYAYACDGRIVGSWHDLKTQLIWQRIRRQRRPWIKVTAICRPNTESERFAASLLSEALVRSSLAIK